MVTYLMIEPPVRCSHCQERFFASCGHTCDYGAIEPDHTWGIAAQKTCDSLNRTVRLALGGFVRGDREVRVRSKLDAFTD